MTSYAEIFDRFPPELRQPLTQLVDALKDELGVKRTDFEELKTIVRELAQAQHRTETRVEELVQAQHRTETRVEELVQAQHRTETRVEELVQAQHRTETRVEELVQAQHRTETRVEELTQALKDLAQAQQRSEERLDHLTGELASFRRTFDAKVGGLGARWGMQTESAFREGMQAILREVGFTTERFLEYDAEGDVFGYPEYVELDVVVKNGKLIVVEIKSSLDKGNTYLFERKAVFYARKTGRQVDRKLIVTPYADHRAVDVAARLAIEICTDIHALP